MNLYSYRDNREGRCNPEGDTRPIVFFTRAELSCQADGAFEKDQGAPWDDMEHIVRCVILEKPKLRKIDKTWGGAKVW